MPKTYAAVQHAPQRISIDHLEDGKYVAQVSFWFSNRGAAKAELERLCAADNVPAFSQLVVALDEVQARTIGRPALPPEQRRDARIELRVQADTKAAWQARADAARMTLTAWAEARLNAAKT